MSRIALYEKDFYAWTQEQADLIRRKNFSKIDIAHFFIFS